MSEETPKTNKTNTLKKEEWREDLSKEQKSVLEALEACHGVVTTACELAQVSRTQFYKWKKDNEEFAQKVEEASEVAIDFVENKLFERIEEGSDTAILFFLKTRAKKRGYVERSELTGANGGPIQTEDVGLTNTERLERLVALANAARARGSGESSASNSGNGEG